MESLRGILDPFGYAYKKLTGNFPTSQTYIRQQSDMCGEESEQCTDISNVDLSMVSICENDSEA